MSVGFKLHVERKARLGSPSRSGGTQRLLLKAGPQFFDTLKILGLDAIKLHLIVRIADLVQNTRARNDARLPAKMHRGLFRSAKNLLTISS